MYVAIEKTYTLSILFSHIVSETIIEYWFYEQKSFWSNRSFYLTSIYIYSIKSLKNQRCVIAFFRFEELTSCCIGSRRIDPWRYFCLVMLVYIIYRWDSSFLSFFLSHFLSFSSSRISESSLGSEKSACITSHSSAPAINIQFRNEGTWYAVECIVSRSSVKQSFVGSSNFRQTATDEARPLFGGAL